MFRKLREPLFIVVDILYCCLSNNEERLKYWCDHPDKLKEKLTELLLGEEVLAAAISEAATLLQTAQLFYRRHFGLMKDFSGLHVPPKPNGNYRLVVVSQGMTPNKSYAACEKLFRCWKPRENLDTGLENDLRQADHDYAVWIYARGEAEEQFANKSFNGLKATRANRPTLTERMLLEIQVWEKAVEYLDEKTITRCDASQYPGGCVPCVSWNDNYGMIVNEYNPECRYGDLRSRSVVSC